MVEMLWELSAIEVANPTKLDNQNVSFVTELTITDYNITVDVFI